MSRWFRQGIRLPGWRESSTASSSFSKHLDLRVAWTMRAAGVLREAPWKVWSRGLLDRLSTCLNSPIVAVAAGSSPECSCTTWASGRCRCSTNPSGWMPRAVGVGSGSARRGAGDHTADVLHGN
jgi:hypothetical protein